ncbi:hypothetical protein ACQY0O_008036 [Thecaphora frezii]
MSKTNLLIDLNGTCHVGETETPGAIDALRRLRRLQQDKGNLLKIRFCSNTTKESTSSLLAKLRRVGFTEDLIEQSDLFTSLDATRRYVERSGLSPLLLLSRSAQSAFSDDAELASRCFFAWPDRPPSTLGDEAKKALTRCDAVVVGLCPELMTQSWLDEAFRLLSGEYAGAQGKKVQLIATHRALYHRPNLDSPLSMGPGAFISALEAAARFEPSSTRICGKPSRTFLEECLHGMVQEIGENESNVPQRNVIIGDDIDADLGGDTTLLGLERVLVRTGKYRGADETRTQPPPHATYDTFADWVGAFVSEMEAGR